MTFGGHYSTVLLSCSSDWGVAGENSGRVAGKVAGWGIGGGDWRGRLAGDWRGRIRRKNSESTLCLPPITVSPAS
jgi:hypothetical protein